MYGFYVIDTQPVRWACHLGKLTVSHELEAPDQICGAKLHVLALHLGRNLETIQRSRTTPRHEDYFADEALCCLPRRAILKTSVNLLATSTGTRSCVERDFIRVGT